MAVIHEIQQLITCDTPFGEAQALFIMDYGIHRNTIWVCASFKDGKIRHFDSNQITITRNDTLEFNTKNKWDKLNEEFDNALNSMTNDDWDKIKMKNSMKAKLIKIEDGYKLLIQGFLKGSTNHELIDSLNVEEGNIRYKLSLKNCQAIEHGYDLDELAKEANGYLYYDSKKENKALAFDDGYHVGFQKALELIGDKKFSEEDVRKAIDIARNGSMQEQHNGYGRPTELRFVLDNISSDEIIQSLQQTEWDVEIEMEYVGECNGNNDEGCFQDSPGHNCGCFERRPKLDADGCLILKRI